MFPAPPARTGSLKVSTTWLPTTPAALSTGLLDSSTGSMSSAAVENVSDGTSVESAGTGAPEIERSTPAGAVTVYVEPGTRSAAGSTLIVFPVNVTCAVSVTG